MVAIDYKAPFKVPLDSSSISTEFLYAPVEPVNATNFNIGICLFFFVCGTAGSGKRPSHTKITCLVRGSSSVNYYISCRLVTTTLTHSLLSILK